MMIANSSEPSCRDLLEGNTSRLLRKVDIFGAKVPTFNIQGSSKVNSNAGGLLTLLLFFLSIGFAARRLENLLLNRVSYVTTYNDDEAFEELGASVNLLDNDFAVAFGIDDWQDGIRNDPRYVKWIAVEHIRQDSKHYRINH